MRSQSRQHNYVCRHNVRPCPLLLLLWLLLLPLFLSLVADYSRFLLSAPFVRSFVRWLVLSFLLSIFCSRCSFVSHVEFSALSSDCIFFCSFLSFISFRLYSVWCTNKCVSHRFYSIHLAGFMLIAHTQRTPTKHVGRMNAFVHEIQCDLHFVDFGTGFLSFRHKNEE